MDQHEVDEESGGSSSTEQGGGSYTESHQDFGYKPQLQPLIRCDLLPISPWPAYSYNKQQSLNTLLASSSSCPLRFLL